ncbi:protein cordon-bleu [Engraulis encrasicolus]|uniref:protein cordon-bleu n=1 Tax=Engraulis encrasicolus TaxID=184585 RepID=UPI002FD37B24
MASNSYTKPPTGRRMKNPAPPPPGPPQPAPRRLPVRNVVPDGGVAVSGDAKENILRPLVELQLTLPNGGHTTTAFDGRKALMDVLVEVCARYHLNPACHSLELQSSQGQPVAFKPNGLLGSLDVASGIIRERTEEKLARKPAPKVPEKTIRLVVNYHRSQKTVVRVNPLVPLHTLVPTICQKCEFDPAHVLLLRDSVSRHELDLNKSLSDLEIRELYAFDQSLVLQPKMASAPALNYYTDSTSTQSATVEKKGILGFFKFNRRKSKTDSLSSSDMEEVDGGHVESAETGHHALSGMSSSLCVEARPSTLGQSQSAMNISRLSPKTDPKKRRAPAPPPATPCSFSSIEMDPGSPSISSLLKKRKAPAPPPTPASETPGTTPTPTPFGSTTISTTTTGRVRKPSSTCSAPATLAAATTAAATVAMPPVTATRRTTAPGGHEDSASELSIRSSSSEELERGAALGSSSSSSSQASVPSSHLDEVAVSSQDEEDEYEDVEDDDEEDEEVEMEDVDLDGDVETVMQQLQQQALKQQQQQQQQKMVQPAQPVVVERLQQQPQQAAQRSIQSSREELVVAEPKLQQPQPKATPVQPKPVPVQQVQPQAPVQKQEQRTAEKLRHSDRRSSTTPDSAASVISLRIEEAENNRHSAVDGSRQVPPPKPRRTSLGDQTSLAPSASPAPLDRNSHNASPDSFTDMPQHSWLHSAPAAVAAEVPATDAVETGSVSSSSGSLADQGYAASDGTAEDPCALGLPADTNRSPPRAQRDVSSDSDEGCATWNSRTSSQERFEKDQSAKVKDSYKEDPKIMAQLQLTLADLDAELAEMTRGRETPSEAGDIIPVSVVDLVPVTAIDDVIDSHLYCNGIGDHDDSAAQMTSQNIQNKNNNATLCREPEVQQRVSEEVKGAKETKQVKQGTSDSKSSKSKSEIPVSENKKVVSASKPKPAAEEKEKVTPPSTAKQSAVAKEKVVPPSATKQPAVDKERIVQAPVAKQPPVGPPSGTSTFVVVPPKADVIRHHHQDRTKITEVPASRFGTRTFTIVPPTAAVRSAAQTKASLSLGAIKIDDQGNMVVGGGSRRVVGSTAVERKVEEEEKVEAEEAAALPLQEKAKAFWSSTSSQEASTATKTATAAPQKARDTEVKSGQGSAVPKPAEKTPTAIPAVSSSFTTAVNSSLSSQVKDSKPAASEPAASAQKADTASSQETRDLSFLKPQKRTSSQYMASALSNNRYVVKPAAAKASGIQEKPEPEPPTSSVPKASVEVRSTITTINGSTVKGTSSTTQMGSSSTTQLGLRKGNGSFTRAVRSPPSYRSHTFPKQTTEEPTRPLEGGSGTASQVTTETPETTTTTPSSSVSQAGHSQEPCAAPGVLPEPNQVSLFGPVKKFRPVIQKSVEKEASLHSSLMEAIQSGDGKERLKRVTESSGSSKKPTMVEEENSHSALLSAIRASNTDRLKKTRSLAAKELDRFKSMDPDDVPLKNPYSSAAHPAASASIPTPPPPPMAVPPPPRAMPVSAANAEQSREALLEAIRTGAGAKSLKRVPLPTKTVQVNGRLGTIQASRPSSSSSSDGC